MSSSCYSFSVKFPADVLELLIEPIDIPLGLCQRLINEVLGSPVSKDFAGVFV
jgi:hypothetical protein